MFYDPRGQVIRTVNPDGSEQRVVFGVPDDSERSGRFEPTPWEAYTYDANDNAGRTHPDASTSYRHHWNTPASVEVDALGRTIADGRAQRAGPGDRLVHHPLDLRHPGTCSPSPTPWAAWPSSYVYDLADAPLRIDSIDAGVRRTVLDAAGNGSKRATARARSSCSLRCAEPSDPALGAGRCGEPLTLRERLVYGDGAGLGHGAAAGGRARTCWASPTGTTTRPGC